MAKKYGLDIAFCNEIQKNITMDDARQYYHNHNKKELTFCCPNEKCKAIVSTVNLTKPLYGWAGREPHFKFSPNNKHSSSCEYFHEYTSIDKEKNTSHNDDVNDIETSKQRPIILDIFNELLLINDKIDDERSRKESEKIAGSKKNGKDGRHKKYLKNTHPRDRKTHSFRKIISNYLALREENGLSRDILIGEENKPFQEWFVHIKNFDATKSCIVYSIGVVKKGTNGKMYFHPADKVGNTAYFENKLTSIELLEQQLLEKEHKNVFFAFLYMKNLPGYTKTKSQSGNDKIILGHKYFDFR